MSDFYNKYPYTDFHELNLDWVIERVKKLTEDWAATLEEWNSTEEQWQELYNYVYDYFDNLDVQEEINNKINAMIADGTFVTITTPVIEAKVASMMPGTVASQIGDTVASQIGATVASQIGGTVASQIDDAVISPVNTWLTEHITQPTVPVVDASLSISGAAADAAVTGAAIETASGYYNCIYSGTSTYHYFPVVSGEEYFIKNNGTNDITLQTCDSSGNAGPVIGEMSGHTSQIITPSTSTSYVKFTADSGTINTVIIALNSDAGRLLYNSAYSILNDLNIEQGAVDVVGDDVSNANRIRSVGYITGSEIDIVLKPGFFVHAVVYYDENTHVFDSYAGTAKRCAIIGKSGCVSRLVLSKNPNTNAIVPSDIKMIPSYDDESLSLPGFFADAFVTGNRLNNIDEYQGKYIHYVNNDSTFAMHKFDFIQGHRYLVHSLDGKQTNIFARVTENGANTDIISALASHNFGIWTADDNYHYVRSVSNTIPSEILIYDITALGGKAAYLNNDKPYSRYVEFDHNYDLKDVSSIVSDFDFSDTSQIMDNVYNLFDDLVTDYASYVSKVDAAVFTDMSYPVYANGVPTSETYIATPAYKTYMYKLSDNISPLGNNTINPKIKILIFGGVHGNEYAAPHNLYIMAKELCSNFLSDTNLYNLRAACDIYIVPCVNGYGMIHSLRQNANEVNINRNFPVEYWIERGQETIGTAFNNYSGPTAGSEFETQLMINLIEKIQPDIAIDHHNYSKLEQQYYAEFADKKLKNMLYQAMIDCSIAFKKAYPQYFGTDYGVVSNVSTSAPGEIEDITYGFFPVWANENKIPLAACLEISECINFDNGSYTSEVIDDYGDDTFSIGEYTLMNQIYKFVKCAMNIYDK